MTLYQDLQQLGLTPNQATVYLALTRTGHAKAGEIIKKTGFHRNLVYTALRELIEKKLVTVSKIDGVMQYKILSPSRLLTSAQEKERIARNVIEELKVMTKKTSGHEIVIYEGVDEFRRYEENLYHSFPEGGLIRYLGISPQWQEATGPALEEKLIAIQVVKKTKMKALSNAINREQQSYVDRANGLAEVRVNKLVSSDTNNTVILEDRISIRSFLEPVFVVEITNRALAKNYQNYFDFLWKQSRG